MPSYIGSGARRSRRTPIVLTWLITLLAALIGFSAPGLAAVGYPLVPVANAAGTPICDVVGDENPDQADVACDSAGASAYIGSDGNTVTAGLVLTEDPRTAGADAPLEGFTWQVAIGVNGTQVATMGISGKGTNDTDFLYVKCVSATDPHYVVNATLAIANGTIEVSPTGAYYLLSFTVPLAALAPCGITATTAVQLFFGTSQANNLDVINKDFFTGNGVNFTVVPPITFGGTLAVTKTRTAVAGPNPPELGQTTTYDLVVTAKNPSAYPLANVNVTDTLPGDVAIQSVTPTAGTASVAGQDITWSGFGLVAGESRTLTIRVTITPAPGNVGSPMLLNPGAAGTATRTAGGGTVSDTSGPVSTASVLGPGIGVTKTVAPATVSAGDTVTYTVSLVNAGTATTTVNTVADTLPAGFTYVATTGGTLGAANPVVGTGNVVTWSGPFSIPVGATQTLIFTATASNSPGAFDNVVVADAVTIGPVSTGNTATVTVVPKADLSVTKTASPTTAVAGQTLTYTLGATNAGPGTAPNVQITDVLPASLTFDASASSPACAYAAISRTVTCTAATLAAGAGVSFSVVTMVDPGSTGTITNTAAVRSAIPDTNPAGDSVTLVTPMATQADVSVTVADSPDPVTAGGSLVYGLTATNAGPSNATAVVVSDVLPLDVAFVGAPGCTYDVGSRTVNCAVGTLAPGQSAPFLVTVQVGPGVTSTITNTATATTTTTDVNPANNTATAVTTVAVLADLAITKVAGGPTAIPGGSITYTLGVTNLGPSAATLVQITDVLAPQLTLVSAPGCTYDGPTRTLTCAVGPIGVGANAGRTVIVSIDPAATGTIANTASVLSAVVDPNLANNAATAAVSLLPTADLVATLTDSPDPVVAGGLLTYTATVANAGPSTATDASLTLSIPTGVTLAPASVPTGCTYDLASRLLTCPLGTLGTGSAAPVIVVVSVDPATTGPLGATATVTSTSPDPVAANNTDTATTAVTASANVALIKTASPSPAVPGAPLVYTLTATNAGPSTATGLIITDVLPAGLSAPQVPLPAGCGYNAGTRTVTCTIASLAPGASAGPSFVVTVDPATTSPVVNTATLASSVQDPSPADNVAATATPVAPSADLAAAVSATPITATAGQALSVISGVTNAGPSTATAVVVATTLPPGMVPGALPSGCTFDETTRVVTCLAGALAPGAAVNFTLPTTVSAASSAVATMPVSAVVGSLTPDPALANNTSTAAVTIVAPPVVPPPTTTTTTTVPVTTTTTTTVPVTTTTTTTVPVTTTTTTVPVTTTTTTVPVTTTTTTVPIAAAGPAVIETSVLPAVLTAPLHRLTIASVTKPEPLPAPAVVTRAAPAAVATLPRTGTRSMTLASWGLSFIVGGALLTLPGRRRRCARPVSRESGSPTG